MAAKRKPAKSTRKNERVFKTDGEFLAYVEGLRDGREEAEKKARKEIALRTPQSLKMGSPEGDAWLDAPEQTAVRLAHDVVGFYFHLACILGRAAGSTKSDREWAEQEVLKCARSWVLPPEDNAQNRLTVFLGSFVPAGNTHRRGTFGHPQSRNARSPRTRA